MKASRISVLALLAMTLAMPAYAEDAPAEDELTRLKHEKELSDARDTLAKAELAELETARKIAEEKAAQKRLADEQKTLDINAETALDTAKKSKGLAGIKQLKEIFGDPPAVGKEGGVSFSSEASGQLLEARLGSAEAVVELAGKVCGVLKSKSITGAYLAPSGYELKLQQASIFTAELTALSGEMDAAKEDMSTAVHAASAEAAIAGITAARYLIDGVSQISKAFRADYSYSLSSTVRSTLFERSVAAQCQDQLIRVDLEQYLRRKASRPEAYADLNKISSFVAEYDAGKAALSGKIQDFEKEFSEAEKAKKSKAILDGIKLRIDGARAGLRKLSKYEGLSVRGKAFLESIKGSEEKVLENMAWAGFDLQEHPRLEFTVSSQDVQISKSTAFTALKLTSATTVEVVYAAFDKDNKVLASGVASYSSGKGGRNLMEKGEPRISVKPAL